MEVEVPEDIPDLPRELSFWIGAHLDNRAAPEQQALLELTDTRQRLERQFEMLDHTRRQLAARTVLMDLKEQGRLMLAGLLLIAATGVTALLIWLRRDRRYESSDSVAAAYDAWTEDRLLERPGATMCTLVTTANHRVPSTSDRPRRPLCTNWCVGADWTVYPGSRVLDVGCGIGGSAWILARDYGFEVLGVSISPAQIRRATELTPEGLSCRFEVMDALALTLPDQHFDAVWTVEAGPHMPDKQRFADELLRVLRPGAVRRCRLESQRSCRRCHERSGELGHAPAVASVGPPRICEYSRFCRQS